MATRKNKSLTLKAIDGELLPEAQTYQAQLRAAVADHVDRDDVRAVVEAITKRAKEGDDRAVKQFFDYVLGGSTAPQSVSVHNHVHYASVEEAAQVEQRKNQLRLSKDAS